MNGKVELAALGLKFYLARGPRAFEPVSQYDLELSDQVVLNHRVIN